jgi:hypothetical protein
MEPGMTFIILLSAALGMAGEPFEALAHAGALDGHAYLREGLLLVGAPDQPGRPGYRLTAGRIPASLPEQLAGFERISDSCDRDASRALEPPVTPAPGQRVVAWTQLDMDGRAPDELVLLEAGPVSEGGLLPYAPLSLTLVRLGQRQGSMTLDRTAFPCELRSADVDGDGRSELVLSWESAGGSGTTRGATVFELTDGESP